MRLQSGDKAPQFDTTDIYGWPVRLKDYAGQKVLLCFYRYAGCPFCSHFLHDLILHYEEFMRVNLKIVVFFQSSADEVLKIPAKQKPLFPIVADPDRKIYDLYGVETSVAGAARTLFHMHDFFKAWEEGFPQKKVTGDFFLMPAEFLIGADQKVSVGHYGWHIGDVMGIKEVIRFVLDMEQVNQSVRAIKRGE